MRGRWRIVEMEDLDPDDLDLDGPAYFELDGKGQGGFGFLAVGGWMDCRDVERDGRPGVEFSWDGNDECDPACGRGWATLASDGSLDGRIFRHGGDDWAFRANPAP